MRQAESMFCLFCLFLCFFVLKLQQWELLVLNRLKWDLGTITPHDFVDLLLTRLQATPTAQVRPPTLEETVDRKKNDRKTRSESKETLPSQSLW